MVTTGSADNQAVAMRVIRPGFAVNWRQTVWFFALSSIVMLSIATAFALLGYWPILPFTGLELAALGAALYASARRSLDTQVLRIEGERLLIEKGRRRPDRRWSFRCAWTEVAVLHDRRRWHPRRVVIRSHGEAVEVGEFLDDDGRRDLAADLADWIGPMGRAATDQPLDTRQTVTWGDES